jgi:hypothetical protein
LSTPAFNQPGAGGDKFEPSLYGGALLLVYPHKYVTGIPTKFGEADAVEADIVILDRNGQDGQPIRLNSTMIFQNKMVGQVKGSVGGMVLGRLTQGLNTKGNPPWELADYTPADAQWATAYIAQHPAVSQPSQTQSAPAPVQAPPADVWAGMNAAPAAPPTPAPSGASAGWTPPAPAAPAAPAAAPQLDPNLVAFLQSKGVDTSQITSQSQGEMIAQTFV